MLLIVLGHKKPFDGKYRDVLWVSWVKMPLLCFSFLSDRGVLPESVLLGTYPPLKLSFLLQFQIQSPHVRVDKKFCRQPQTSISLQITMRNKFLLTKRCPSICQYLQPYCRLGQAPSTWWSCRCPCSVQRSWTGWPLRLLFYSNHSVIPWNTASARAGGQTPAHAPTDKSGHWLGRESCQGCSDIHAKQRKSHLRYWE